MTDPLDSMVDDLANRQFIVFAGAGMSKITGVEIWRDLLNVLNESAKLRGIDIKKIDPLHFPEIAQMIYNQLEKEGCVHKYYNTAQSL